MKSRAKSKELWPKAAALQSGKSPRLLIPTQSLLAVTNARAEENARDSRRWNAFPASLNCQFS
jgi:hypothetical protein